METLYTNIDTGIKISLQSKWLEVIGNLLNSVRRIRSQFSVVTPESISDNDFWDAYTKQLGSIDSGIEMISSFTEDLAVLLEKIEASTLVNESGNQYVGTLETVDKCEAAILACVGDLMSEIHSVAADTLVHCKRDNLTKLMSEVVLYSTPITETIKILNSVPFEACTVGSRDMDFTGIFEKVYDLTVISSELATSLLIHSRMSDATDHKFDTYSNVEAAIDKLMSSSFETKNVYDVINKAVATTQANAVDKTNAPADEFNTRIVMLLHNIVHFKQHGEVSKVYKTWKNTQFVTQELTELKDVAGVERLYIANDVVVYEGDKDSKSMFFVMEGNVEVYKGYGTESQQMLVELGPGAIFGEMSLFLHEERSATVVAKDNVVALEVQQRDMYEFIRTFPAITYSMLETLCTRLKNMTR